MTGQTIGQLVANHWAEPFQSDDEEVLGFWNRALESYADAGAPRVSRTGQFKQLYDAARQGVVARSTRRTDTVQRAPAITTSTPSPPESRLRPPT